MMTEMMMMTIIRILCQCVMHIVWISRHTVQLIYVSLCACVSVCVRVRVAQKMDVHVKKKLQKIFLIFLETTHKH